MSSWLKIVGPQIVFVMLIGAFIIICRVVQIICTMINPDDNEDI